MANIRQLLETVNASVTKSLLEDNLKKWASNCGLSTKDILQQLAAAQPLSPAQLMVKTEDDEQSLADDEELQSNDKKTRPRALISDDQVAILKAYYAINSKPRREDLLKISEEIGHPFKVVKVWFQNTRARDRREMASSKNSSFPSPAFNLLPPTPPASCSTGTYNARFHSCFLIKNDVMLQGHKSIPVPLPVQSRMTLWIKKTKCHWICPPNLPLRRPRLRPWS